MSVFKRILFIVGGAVLLFVIGYVVFTFKAVQ